MAFLPSAHIAQRVVIEFLPMRCGMPVTFAESLLSCRRKSEPCGPPAAGARRACGSAFTPPSAPRCGSGPAVARKAFYGALGMALAAANYKRAGQACAGPHPRAAEACRQVCSFKKCARASAGGWLWRAPGAAPLSKELAEFYEAIGMPLIEGYGLTEGGVAALNPLDRPKPGSIGKALPGVELRIAEEDSELLMKGPCLFSEYLGDPETTAEVLRDGWLHTGDIAFIDDEGIIFITGRKKELIVSSTGKKIHPSRVESLFKFEPLISQIMLVGDRLPYLTALFTINPAVAETLKGMDSLKGHTTA